MQFSVTTGDAVIQTKSQSFSYGDYPVRPFETNQWTELEVGAFTVKQSQAKGVVDGGKKAALGKGVDVELDCVIREIEGGHWKSGEDLAKAVKLFLLCQLSATISGYHVKLGQCGELAELHNPVVTCSVGLLLRRRHGDHHV